MIDSGLLDKNGVPICDGSRVRVKVELYSGSYSHWYEKTNDRHWQDHFIDMVVSAPRWIGEHNLDGKWTLRKTEETIRQISEIQAPHGKERKPQYIHVPWELTDRGTIIDGKALHIEVVSQEREEGND
jgi:hypothetical protein